MVSNCILPGDLIEEILSRLPVQKLLKLRRVCKSWCFLIDSLRFIQLHYRRQYSICQDELLFCLDSGIDVVVHEHYYLVSDQQCDHVLRLSDGLLSENAALFAKAAGVPSEVRCIGVVNGIVCLQWRHKELGLWNPTTRDFKAVEHWLNLPPPKFASSTRLIGFGYDSVSNDFKIVSGNYTRVHQLDEKYKLYSLSTDTWKSISAPTSVGFVTPSPFTTYLNGVYYWPAETFEYMNDCFSPKFVILTFKFATERFEILDPPKDVLVRKEGCMFDWKIDVYKGSIAVIVNNVNSEIGFGCINIWIVSKSCDGSIVPLSWEHLLSIPQAPAYNLLWANRLTKYGHLILSTTSPNNQFEIWCLLYNISSGTSKKLGIPFQYCFSFIESLFPLSRRLHNM